MKQLSISKLLLFMIALLVCGGGVFMSLFLVFGVERNVSLIVALASVPIAILFFGIFSKPD